MSIEKKINFYKENLDYFEVTMDKYKYLLEQGRNSKPFPEEYRNDNFKVDGCQSQVWLVPEYKEKLLKLPKFLVKNNVKPSNDSLKQALLLSGFFIDKFLKKNNKKLPFCRKNILT